MSEFTSTTETIQPYVPTDVEESCMKTYVDLVVSKDPLRVDSKLITNKDRFYMEKVSKKLSAMFTSSIPSITEDEITVLSNFGQNTMLGIFIINKLGKAHLTTAMKARVKSKVLKLHGESVPKRIPSLLRMGNVAFIIDYYRYVGERIAEGIYSNFVAVYYNEPPKK